MNANIHRLGVFLSVELTSCSIQCSRIGMLWVGLGQLAIWLVLFAIAVLPYALFVFVYVYVFVLIFVLKCFYQL